MVLTPTEYQNISRIPYLPPVHPGILSIDAGTTHHEATRLTLEHDESVRLFRESLELEKVLINITCNALEDTYYKERINPQTNTVTEKLSVFLSWLFDTYGDIDSDTIAIEAKKVLELSYDLQNPITDVFEPIQELEQLAIAGNRPYTQAQIVDFGVTVISNTHDFETALINWHSLPVHSQTWPAFKTHFTIARRFLRKVRGKTMRTAGFHQANLISSNLETV